MASLSLSSDRHPRGWLGIPGSGLRTLLCFAAGERTLAELRYFAESSWQLRQEKEPGFPQSGAEPPFLG